MSCVTIWAILVLFLILTVIKMCFDHFTERTQSIALETLRTKLQVFDSRTREELAKHEEVRCATVGAWSYSTHRLCTDVSRRRFCLFSLPSLPPLIITTLTGRHPIPFFMHLYIFCLQILIKETQARAVSEATLAALSTDVSQKLIAGQTGMASHSTVLFNKLHTHP